MLLVHCYEFVVRTASTTSIYQIKRSSGNPSAIAATVTHKEQNHKLLWHAPPAVAYRISDSGGDTSIPNDTEDDLVTSIKQKLQISRRDTVPFSKSAGECS